MTLLRMYCDSVPHQGWPVGGILRRITDGSDPGGGAMRKWIGVVALGLLAAAPALAQKKASLTPMDYEEIRALYSKYVYGYDTGDAQLVASVFAPDAALVIGGKVICDSREKITSGIKPRMGLAGMRHIPTNILIEPSAEGAK